MRSHSVLYIAMPAIVAVLLFGSCGSRRSSWDTDSTMVVKGEAYQAVEEERGSLDSVEWVSPAQYNSLVKAKIGEATALSNVDRLSLLEGLNKSYAEQLVRTMGAILHSDCAPRHTTLYAASREYAAHSKDFGSYVPEAKADVDAELAEHDKMMAFSVSTSYPAVSSPLASYDASYDRAKQSEAAAIRAKNPTCSAIRAKVDAAAVDKQLRARRESYYSRLVARYCADPNPDAYTLDRLRQIIRPSASFASLSSRAEAHLNKHRKL